MTTTWTSEATGVGAYADVNGLHMYYETHGEGPPIILLHGGLGSGDMFGPNIPKLVAGGYQVICPDLQGHGRTADIDRPIDEKLFADDIAALIRHLGFEQADVVGYSLGGGTALWTAAKYPELVRKLVLTSVYLRPDAVDPALIAQQEQLTGDLAEQLVGTPMHETYMRLAPRPEDFPRLISKIGAVMQETFDFTGVVRDLKVPTLLVSADADQAPPSHAVEMFKLLDGGLRDGGWMNENRPQGGHALAILPGLTHYTIFASPLLADVVLAFLDASGT